MVIQLQPQGQNPGQNNFGLKKQEYQPGNPYAGLGGKANDDKSYAYDGFYKSYGRAPTTDEMAQILPAYAGTDKNVTDFTKGDAFVAQMHQATENTPEKLYAKQQAEYKKNAPQHYDDIQRLFQNSLGREASQEELDHFGSALASGQVDQYDLQEFIKQQPEYQTNQNAKMVSGLSDKLSLFDKQYYQGSILPSLQEAYTKQGRSFDSSSFQQAATNSAQQQNVGRQQYLAQLSAQQYGNTSERAYQDYANQVANNQNRVNSGINAQYQGIQNSQNRSNEISDYNTQAQLYNQYLSKYGKRNNGMGGLIGGLAGAGIGAYFGGPAGGQLGYGLGSGVGSAVQNSGGSY
jgi:hypothetical protein